MLSCCPLESRVHCVCDRYASHGEREDDVPRTHFRLWLKPLACLVRLVAQFHVDVPAAAAVGSGWLELLEFGVACKVRLLQSWLSSAFALRRGQHGHEFQGHPRAVVRRRGSAGAFCSLLRSVPLSVVDSRSVLAGRTMLACCLALPGCRSFGVDLAVRAKPRRASQLLCIHAVALLSLSPPLSFADRALASCCLSMQVVGRIDQWLGDCDWLLAQIKSFGTVSPCVVIVVVGQTWAVAALALPYSSFVCLIACFRACVLRLHNSQVLSQFCSRFLCCSLASTRSGARSARAPASSSTLLALSSRLLYRPGVKVRRCPVCDSCRPPFAPCAPVCPHWLWRRSPRGFARAETRSDGASSCAAVSLCFVAS